MNTLLATLISWLQLYGYPALWIGVFLAAVGAPLPINLVLLAAGAFATLGDFNLTILIIVSTTASVAGDCTGFLIGHLIGSRGLSWLTLQKRFGFISPKLVIRSQDYFQRRGALAIFFSRWLVTALGGVINVLAGAELYPFRNFLLYDFAGELIGSLLPLGLGAIFGESWQAIGDIITTASTLTLVLCVVLILLAFLLHMLRKSRKTTPASETNLEAPQSEANKKNSTVEIP